MKDFLGFLKKRAPAEYGKLKEAGGLSAARKGSDGFVKAWKQIAKDDPKHFAILQHEFIKKTLYEPQANALKQAFRLDISKRAVALQEVVWSMAVQHGRHTQTIFDRALTGRDISKLSDKEIIRSVYAERTKVEIYFKHSSPNVREAVRKRLIKEEKEATKMLGGANLR